MFRPTELSGLDFNSHSDPTLYSYYNFIICSVSDIISAIAFVSRHIYFNWNFNSSFNWNFNWNFKLNIYIPKLQKIWSMFY